MTAERRCAYGTCGSPCPIAPASAVGWRRRCRESGHWIRGDEELLRRPWWYGRPSEALIAAPQDSQFISVGTHAGPASVARRAASRFRCIELRRQAPRVDSLARLAGDAVAARDRRRDVPVLVSGQRQVGFFADRKLKKISISGGAVTTLTEASYGAGGTWNRDGTIVFASSLNGGLLRVSSAGGAPRPATALNTERHARRRIAGRCFSLTDVASFTRRDSKRRLVAGRSGWVRSILIASRT